MSLNIYRIAEAQNGAKYFNVHVKHEKETHRNTTLDPGGGVRPKNS